MSDEAGMEGQFPRDLDDLYAPGARMLPRAKTPERIEDSPAFVTGPNHPVVNLAAALEKHSTAVIDATRPLREALIDQLHRYPPSP